MKEKKKSTIKEQELETIIKTTFWMARRYAHGRHTYAPAIIRDAFLTLQKYGITIGKDVTINPPKKEEIKGRHTTEARCINRKVSHQRHADGIKHIHLNKFIKEKKRAYEKHKPGIFL